MTLSDSDNDNDISDNESIITKRKPNKNRLERKQHD